MIVPNLPVPSHPSHDIMDSTKLKEYMECPRKFFFKYILGWNSSRPSNHLVFGSAVHLAMEHLILNGYHANAVVDAMELFNSHYREQFPQETDFLYEPKTPMRFFGLLLEYIKEYATDHADFEVYKTEIGGTIPLSSNPNHVLAWKMDTILFNRHTQMYFSLEHKTKQGNSINKSYEIDFKMGPQVGTYTHVLNSLFNPMDVEGIIINCMCMKKTKQPEFILKRIPIHMNNTNMLVWLEMCKSWLDTIHLDYLALSDASDKDDVLKPFKMNPGSCSNWGATCQYCDLCQSWPNPLQHLHQMPLDMELRFWDPLVEENLKEIMKL